MEPSLAHKVRWEEIKNGDKTRIEFVETLLKQLDVAQTKLAKIELERDKYEEAWDDAHMKNKDLKNDLKSERSKLDGNTFVSVLIDGDCMNFLDDLVECKERGGQEAAQKLLESTQDYLHAKFDTLSRDIKVIITVCCNLRGLSKTCVDANILDRPEEFSLFVRGFNMGNPLCLMVDAGSGKECSDDKLRELFKLHIGQLQCKHIIFGGSADNGYARLFSQYTTNQQVRDRLTLLEGPPFAAELAALKGNFHQIKFSNIFRDAKLPARRVSFCLTPPKSTSPGPQTYASTASTPVLSSSSVAIPKSMPIRSVNNYGLDNNGSSSSSTPQSIASATQNPNRIHWNASGHRIDPPITRPPPQKLSEMKNQKMCNNFVFRGTCYNDPCQHPHVKVTDAEYMAARRILARTQPCDNGPFCNIPDCFYGHHCARGVNCKRDHCKFIDAMHLVDMRTVVV